MRRVALFGRSVLKLALLPLGLAFVGAFLGARSASLAGACGPVPLPARCWAGLQVFLRWRRKALVRSPRNVLTQTAQRPWDTEEPASSGVTAEAGTAEAGAMAGAEEAAARAGGERPRPPEAEGPTSRSGS